MARTSNKDKALAYATDKGIILTMEDADAGDELGAGAIEVWSLDAHLSESGSDCHTYFARGNTEPRAWADALAYMERLTECGDDCPCRDNGQDDGRNEAEVWVCGCCARMVNTGDDSGCRDFHGHTHPTCDKNIVRADIEHTYEVGYFDVNCNGCGSLIRNGGILYAAIRLTNN